MQWITQRSRAGGLCLLALLGLASLGPWAFERINVPAQYTCSAPYVRLVGDYCGQPVSGLLILVTVAGALPTLSVGTLTGQLSLADRGRELGAGLQMLLTFLPLASALVWIWSGSPGRPRLFHYAAWGLALAAVLGLLPYALALPPRLLWGLWLHIGLVLSVSGGAVALVALRRWPSLAA